MIATNLAKRLRLGWLPALALAGGIVLLGSVPASTADDVDPAKAAPAAKKAAPLTEEQKRIRLAVKKGIAFLKASQNVKGSWSLDGHSVGYAAMPGLALLEVGVSANDATVQRAAQHVRAMAIGLAETYDLGLALLFLDKLGDRRDAVLIRTLSLRLIAGQTAHGGWGYKCPLLDYEEEQRLLTFLRKNQPLPDLVRTEHPYLVPLPKSLEMLVDPLTRRDRSSSDNPLALDPLLFDFNINPLPKEDPLAKKATPAKEPELKFDLFEPFVKPDAPEKKVESAKRPVAVKLAPKIPAPRPVVVPVKLAATAVDIRKWPAVHDFVRQDLARSVAQIQPKGKGRKGGPWALPTGDDNSNTQFAILGLWAARRHGVPVALTLNRLDERFRTSQTPAGTWGYRFSDTGQAGGSVAMTCVGLLGLGIAHGSFQETMKPKQEPGLLLHDPTIQRGLAALSQSIGPTQNQALPAAYNLYFLWSVERVAMMYQLPTLNNIDWHSWGARLLLPRQSASGGWQLGSYPGSSPVLDTSMALLFLGRANLSRDLSDSLRQNVVVLDPGRANKK